jgi:hypothetical protein
MFVRTPLNNKFVLSVFKTNLYTLDKWKWEMGDIYYGNY